MPGGASHRAKALNRARRARRSPRSPAGLPTQRGFRGGGADRGGREQAPGDEERPADLLVGRDRDANEPAYRRELGGGEQHARLADARLAFEGDRGEAVGRLSSSWEMASSSAFRPMTPPDRAAELDRERALGPNDGSSTALPPLGVALVDVPSRIMPRIMTRRA